MNLINLFHLIKKNMKSKETLNKNEINEITIIYDYNKSKDIKWMIKKKLKKN